MQYKLNCYDDSGRAQRFVPADGPKDGPPLNSIVVAPMDYVHFNPVKHGYVSMVAHWPIRHFIGG